MHIALLAKRALPIAILSAFAVPARAQSAGDVPGAASKSVASPVIQAPGRAKRQTVGHAKTRPAETEVAKTAPPWAAVDPARADMSPSALPQSPSNEGNGPSRLHIDADHIDYGMKAHGANVSAGQTREQNYDGNVTGLGGEVGLKLHF